VKHGGTKTVVQLLQRVSANVDSYLDLMDAAADILRAVASRESAQIAIQNEGTLGPLLDILQDAETSDEGKTEEEKKEDDKKLGEIKAALVELVVSVTLAGKLRQPWTHENHRRQCFRPKLISLHHGHTRSLVDANMVPIFNNKEIMERFLSWLDLADREDLQTTAALCLGNVARSGTLISMYMDSERQQGIDTNVFVGVVIDQHCVKLVHEYQALDPLIHVVRKATDLKASHAATGVLRNLALAGMCPGNLIRS
jgi:hypothetical protein